METTKPMEPTEKRQNATVDLSVDARNAAGHWGDCPYWDWPDFEKCDCADGLATVPSRAKAYTVVPMPLRDHFAASVVIPWEEALNLAAAEVKERIALGGGVTLAEIIVARVRLRYLEADAMIEQRKIAPRQSFEAGQEKGEDYSDSLQPEDPPAELDGPETEQSGSDTHERAPTVDEAPAASR